MKTAATSDTSSAPWDRTGRRWRVFVTSFVVILAPMLLWALASPMMSAPDEASHAIRAAAVARGQIESVPWDQDLSLARAEVPRSVAHAHELSCYKFRPDISAGCVRPVEGDPTDIVVTGTSAGLNSPAYYAIVGLPTLVMDGTPALYAMRALSAVLSAAALAVMFMQLMQLPRSRWVIVAAAVAVTPMVLYLGGSINPNGVEVASAGALLATLVLTLQTPASRRLLWERAALVVVTAAALLSTRSISLLWVLIIVGAALVFANPRVVAGLVRQPAAWVAIGACGLVSGLTVAWYLGLATFAEHPTANTGSSPTIEFFTMVLRTLDFSDGLIGFFGWTDTPSPSFSIIVFSFGIVTVLVAAVAWGSRRGKFAVLGLALVMVLVPAITQAILISSIGSIWQGRYMLAMMMCLLVACGLAIDDSDHRPQPSAGLKRFVITLLALLSIGQVFSFVSTLRRYMVTVNGGIEAMFMAPSWQPPVGWLILTAVLVAAVTVGAQLTYRAAFRESRTAVGPLDAARPEPASAA
ncbi:MULTISPECIES: DUF2142 domain-containing protein [unclassified Cryobacterium]|uniref:DUF2142 domain-containing protein n=1 Tax=unclassified Cryobacterium TaxID=2649013 RepID=UPI001069F94A|nr:MULTISPECIES: DUF2142 domain-containing protein [unclassified Cryobacterium]TFC53410.1 DUF2142 domain-containing protein [Cryobacterium sp. TMB3-1-2]TFC69075.1 DUF2142 domain-containing protein [Cryobacterium sp. TMB3-15]TFC76125.1 DUF2142 domain-containing protein [Cryobacterium sp. TMB3-10]TFD43870.1 DUF2142 domain-containing protein [Cryobacterium sp. TMB3-12]